jgi:histidine ammonia-lyase
VLAIEWLTAARALDLRGDRSVSPMLDAARGAFRLQCPGWEGDLVLSGIMAAADEFLAKTNWASMLNTREVVHA